MSTNKKNWTDGEALTTVELQRVATIAAGMDDRAWEALFTPGSVQKKIVPLSEESTTLNPRLLIIPGVTNGAARLQPCLLIAGGSGLPNHINMSAKLETAVDSAQLGANSSGSTRYDLIYATVAYATSATGSRKVKDVGTGITSTQSLTLEKAPQVTVTVLPNVNNASPTATMPADAVDGSSYNFPLAMVTVANGYVAGTAIAQSAITPLWSGGQVLGARLGVSRPASLVSKGGSPTGQQPGSAITKRWNGFNKLQLTIKVTSTSLLEIDVDDSIDWRGRVIFMRGCRFSTTATVATPGPESTSQGATCDQQFTLGPSFPGWVGQTFPSQFMQNSAWNVMVDTSGKLVMSYGGIALLSTSGACDIWWIDIEYTDRFVL